MKRLQPKSSMMPTKSQATFGGFALALCLLGGCQMPQANQSLPKGKALPPGWGNSALKPPLANEQNPQVAASEPEMIVRGQNGFVLPPTQTTAPAPSPGTNRLTRGPLPGVDVSSQTTPVIQQTQGVLPPPVTGNGTLPPPTNQYVYPPAPSAYGAPATAPAPSGSSTVAPPGYAPPPGATYAPVAPYGATPPAVGTYIPPAGQAPGIEAVPSLGPQPGLNGGMYGPAVNSPTEPFGPIREVPVDIWLTEARTGRFMIGGAVNSDAGVTGQIVLDERNFDITRVPRSFSELFSGRAFRGAGQSFRIEAVPGSEFQRYMVSFAEPYLLGYLPLSFSINGFLFDRRYRDFDETRVGGRTSLGYRITPDLTLEVGLRGESVDFRNPRILGIPEVDNLVGDHDLYGTQIRLTHDTRDIPFAPTEGHLLSLEYEQIFGSFDYPRFNGRFQNFNLIKQRPDGSGRHTLAFSYDLGISGSQTPIFENYFAGGYSTLRGFEFRGAGPEIGTFQTGGRFRFLGSAEYQFPLTADDMFKGVVFLDYGTVERDIEFNSENLRVAPGFGFRVAIPAMGPAPLAFDFGFPIASAPTDEKQMFSFFVGFNR